MSVGNDAYEPSANDELGAIRFDRVLAPPEFRTNSRDDRTLERVENCRVGRVRFSRKRSDTPKRAS